MRGGNCVWPSATADWHNRWTHALDTYFCGDMLRGDVKFRLVIDMASWYAKG
jgi:hypothetical protein